MSVANVCILDYGSGNVQSVFNLFVLLTPNVVVSNEAEAIRRSTHIVLPGVGAFGAAMEKIKAKTPLLVLTEEVLIRHKPFLGICVGMQVLADKGMEFGEHEGLGWIPGVVEKIRANGLAVPHMGWNDIHAARSSRLLANFGERPDFYFVHSFVFKPLQSEDILATTDYGETFPSIINRGNIYGVQFHPEKSQKSGTLILKNFLSLS